jgi:hypothetical protein
MKQKRYKKAQTNKQKIQFTTSKKLSVHVHIQNGHSKHVNTGKTVFVLLGGINNKQGCAIKTK